MKRRRLLLIVIAILGLLVALGLQGCGLFGGGGDDGDSAEGEAVQGEAGEGAEAGEAPGPGGGGRGGPAGGGGRGAPGPGAEGPGPGPGAPAGAASAADAGSADERVSDAMAAKHDGNYAAARDDLEKALASNPDDAEAHRILGWIYAEMAASGQPSMKGQALEHFQAYLESDEAGGSDAEEVEDAIERMQ